MSTNPTRKLSVVSHRESHDVRDELRQRPISPVEAPIGWRPSRPFRRAAKMLVRVGRKSRKARARMVRLAARGNGQAVRRG
jgi:hypothetical protein